MGRPKKEKGNFPTLHSTNRAKTHKLPSNILIPCRELFWKFTFMPDKISNNLRIPFTTFAFFIEALLTRTVSSANWRWLTRTQPFPIYAPSNTCVSTALFIRQLRPSTLSGIKRGGVPLSKTFQELELLSRTTINKVHHGG